MVGDLLCSRSHKEKRSLKTTAYLSSAKALKLNESILGKSVRKKSTQLGVSLFLLHVQVLLLVFFAFVEDIFYCCVFVLFSHYLEDDR